MSSSTHTEAAPDALGESGPPAAAERSSDAAQPFEDAEEPPRSSDAAGAKEEEEEEDVFHEAAEARRRSEGACSCLKLAQSGAELAEQFKAQGNAAYSRGDWRDAEARQRTRERLGTLPSDPARRRSTPAPWTWLQTTPLPAPYTWPTAPPPGWSWRAPLGAEATCSA